MTKVKICGLMEAEHVQAAVGAGADAVGFVFAPSRRRVDPAWASELAKLVPEGVLKVGVFVNAPEEEIFTVHRNVPLDLIQYHGDESPETIRRIGLPAIKAFSVRTEEDVKRASDYDVDYWLFDAPGTDYRGGSGRVFDWTLLEKAGIPRERTIIAGGLHPGNAADAVAQVRPFALDVSSGVETESRKDPALIRSFIAQVRERREA
ncbi:phosphoribosylanthranilate isomerase [Edaphobacillus lindanitolerans]|uniref:N-(5'-phosphoribosyl)anthranilate isomerase n=1 Tax=Edaphobacillus lindanitolerans TaxID=550447 RepID=A0A1U7PR89_9BACI|nr:phosphoribosylanthranilate isomerase [Edaphobacillus lindanitolerans]SIT87176.1 phosphoribosylanthranilate isomerase [Edaphobacillus lindanitolerans]